MANIERIWVQFPGHTLYCTVGSSVPPLFSSCSVLFFHTAHNESPMQRRVLASWPSPPPPFRVGVGQQQCLPSKSACLLRDFTPFPPYHKKGLVLVPVHPQWISEWWPHALVRGYGCDGVQRPPPWTVQVKQVPVGQENDCDCQLPSSMLGSGGSGDVMGIVRHPPNSRPPPPPLNACCGYGRGGGKMRSAFSAFFFRISRAGPLV